MDRSVLFSSMLWNLKETANDDFRVFLCKLSKEQEDGIYACYMEKINNKENPHFDPMLKQVAMDYWKFLQYDGFEESQRVRQLIDNNSRDVFIFTEEAELEVVGQDIAVRENGLAMIVSECFYNNKTAIEYWVISVEPGSFYLETVSEGFSFNTKNAGSGYVYFPFTGSDSFCAFSVKLCKKLSRKLDSIVESDDNNPFSVDNIVNGGKMSSFDWKVSEPKEETVSLIPPKSTFSIVNGSNSSNTEGDTEVIPELSQILTASSMAFIDHKLIIEKDLVGIYYTKPKPGRLFPYFNITMSSEILERLVNYIETVNHTVPDGVIKWHGFRLHAAVIKNGAHVHIEIVEIS